MSYKKFDKNEIFYNTIKTKPRFEFLLGFDKNFYLGAPNSLFNLNLNGYFLSKIKDSDGVLFRTVNEVDTYGSSDTSINKTFPLIAKISCSFFQQNNEINEFLRAKTRLHVHSLKNILDANAIHSKHYLFSSSLGDKSSQSINLISIPSVFYGSSIEKGSVELGFYITGSLSAKLEDKKLNGELIEVTGSNTGSVAGVILYEQGIICLTGSWQLNNSFTDVYTYTGQTADLPTYPKWIYWGAGLDKQMNNTGGTHFSLKFNGINYVNTITMFANAEKGDLNHSNNLTYIKYGEINKTKTLHTAHSYVEPEYIEIKNTTKYLYENFTDSLEKQTFITKIGIYDEEKNLIGIAKLSKPVKKKENRDFTFKLKLDI